MATHKTALPEAVSVPRVHKAFDRDTEHHGGLSRLPTLIQSLLNPRIIESPSPSHEAGVFLREASVSAWE